MTLPQALGAMPLSPKIRSPKPKYIGASAWWTGCPSGCLTQAQVHWGLRPWEPRPSRLAGLPRTEAAQRPRQLVQGPEASQ
jgi:hypothetical protein